VDENWAELSSPVPAFEQDETGWALKSSRPVAKIDAVEDKSI